MRAAIAQDKQKTLAIDQLHYGFGKWTVYTNRKALKIVSPVGSYILAMAPTWRIVVFNPVNKLGFAVPYAKYIKSGVWGPADQMFMS
ncbi:MAG: hypothetical protein ACRD3W_11250, partial [Terriglobales bacterium]